MLQDLRCRENISYISSYTLTGQEMNEYINSWKLTTLILSIQMIMIQMQNKQQLQLYSWAGGNMENTGCYTDN